ncbi:MAG: dCTP deaminase [Nitrospirae bacterium]|nr:dCTP deaminase [Nitrospirota bacterium]
MNIKDREIAYYQLLINIEKYQEKVRLNYKGEFVLHPGQLIIGSTLEYIRLPESLMCYVIGKSSWGRMGLIIATATKVDPGFKGCITLEIINEGEVPIILYPGIPIAQLVFHETNNSVTYEGSYNCATGPEFPKFSQKSKSWEFWLPNRKLRK